MNDYSKKLADWRKRRQWIRRLRKEGVSVIDIATRFGISRQMVYKLANGK